MITRDAPCVVTFPKDGDYLSPDLPADLFCAARSSRVIRVVIALGDDSFESLYLKDYAWCLLFSVNE